MALNNFDDDQFNQESFGEEEFTPEPEKKRSNKTFLIAIGVVGVIFVVALVLLLLVAPKLLANQRAAQQEQAALINAANTATALAATSMAQQQATLFAKTTVAPSAPTPTKTPIVVVVENTPVGGSDTSQLTDEELATVSALQTQMAGLGNSSSGTATAAAIAAAATATALPTTGFADEVGLPMMAGMAVILVAVIMLSRRLRLGTR